MTHVRSEPTKELQSLIGRAKQLLAEHKLDLSSDEDLSIAAMNLISIEEHLFFTGEKTGKPAYFDIINEVRAIRKETMKQLLPEYEGEVWCIAKHLLAASMRLMEVGTKKLQDGNKDAARRLFDQSFSLYSLFWSVRLKMNDPTASGAAASAVSSTGAADRMEIAQEEKKEAAVKEFVSKLVDCCGE